VGLGESRGYPDKVIVRIAEKQVPALAIPHQPLRELEPAGKSLNLGAGRQDGIEPRILSEHLSLDRNSARTRPSTIEIEYSGLYPYEIIRASGNRTVNSEDCQLNFLPWDGIPGDYQPIRGIETLDNWPATLAVYGGQRAIHPDFGIVVNHNLGSNGGSRCLEFANLFGNCHVDSIPVEADFAGRAPGLESSWLERLPLGIVEVSGARVGGGGPRLVESE